MMMQDRIFYNDVRHNTVYLLLKIKLGSWAIAIKEMTVRLFSQWRVEKTDKDHEKSPGSEDFMAAENGMRGIN